jgi:alpha-tubulin suppressor-like RCC1 family protein/chitodextrinase
MKLQNLSTANSIKIRDLKLLVGVLLLIMALTPVARLRAANSLNTTAYAYSAIRKQIQLDFTSGGGTPSFKLYSAPKNGKVEYYDVATSTYKVLALGVSVPTKTWYYTSNTGFLGTDTFGWTGTDSVGSDNAGCTIIMKPDLYGKDWPQYRNNEFRQGETAMELPDNLYLQWTLELPTPQRAWERQQLLFDPNYEPIVMGKTMFVGFSGSDKLLALDTSTGVEKWRFYAGGPIRFSPVATAGKVCVASDDGYLYGLDAATGAELWKVRGGPSNQLIFGNRRMVSNWPIRGGPLLGSDGLVYFACGLVPSEGVFVYAINPSTGSVVWKNDESGAMTVPQPHDGDHVAGLSPQGYLVMNAAKTKVMIPSGHALPGYFDRLTGKMDTPWNQGGTRNANTASVYVNLNGKCDYAYQFNGITAGTKTYTTGPGITDMVHTIIAADDRLFVVTPSHYMMSKYMPEATARIYCFGATSVATPPVRTPANIPLPTVTDHWKTEVTTMLAGLDYPEGSCIVAGIGSGRLVEELAKQSKFYIDVFDSNPAKVNALRRKLDDARMYGGRALTNPQSYTAKVAVHLMDSSNYNFPTYGAKLIVSEDLAEAGFATGTVFVNKIFSSLRPYGGCIWLYTSSAEHTSFQGWVSSLSLPSATVSRNGSYSVLQRAGKLLGSTDYVKPSSGGTTSPDANVKGPFGTLWWDDAANSALSSADIAGGLIAYGGPSYDVYTGLPLSVTTSYSGTPKIVPGVSFTGPTSIRTNPFNNTPETRAMWQGYGCSAGFSDYGKLATFRSGTMAYYDLQRESGPVNIAGMRPLCGNIGMIPANGVLVLRSYECGGCEYPLGSTALVMVHRPTAQELGTWGYNRTTNVVEDQPVRKVGLNFGAVGDRMENGTVWLQRPYSTYPTPEIPVLITPDSSVQKFSHDPSWVQSGSGYPWVSSTGVKGMNQISVNLGYPTLLSLSAATPPVMDGSLSDACWNGAGKLIMYHINYKKNNPLADGEVQIRHDANNLYVGCRFTGCDVSKIYQKQAGWDIWLSDRVKLKTRAIHLRVDCSNVKHDGVCFTTGHTEDGTWTMPWSSGFSANASEFIVEFQVPWASLAAEGYDKNTLIMNIQGPGTLASKNDVLRLRTLQDDHIEEAPPWSPGRWVNCELFTAVSLNSVAGDLGKNRTYTVRMHFIEPDDLVAGQRKFDVALQGVTKLTDFDVAAAAGGARKSIVKEFTGITVKDILTVNFTPKVGVPVISGMEIFETGGGGGDTVAPSVPSGLIASTASSSQINLSWTTSTDNVGIVGYKIFRGSVEVNSTSGTTYSDTGLTASTAYSYKVAAFDAAGNVSSQSSAASATTSAASDTTLPTVAITAPASGATVLGTAPITASALDNVGVVGVQFKIDGSNLGAEDTTAPYSIAWNTTAAANGSHTISAVARDAAGNSKTSISVTVTVNNVASDTTAPTVSITSPANGATVANSITVAVSASDNVGVVGVQFKVDGTNLGAEDLSAPYQLTFDTTIVSNGSHALTAIARDAAGNTKTATAVTITVNNGGSSSIITGALAAGSKHSVALKDNGTVWSFGNNQYGQLGDGTTNSSLTPKQASGLTGVVEVAAGDLHTLALKSDGTIWSWGYNSTGQLGDSTSTMRLAPVQVSSLTGIQSIEAGNSHSVALKSDGTVWAWGRNANGQLGNGTNTLKKVPGQVVGLTPIVSIAAGSYYTVVAAQDGTVWSWGLNSVGQLGNGSLVQSLVPVKANGIANVVRVAAGGQHTLALKSDGTVWAWGYNSNGQLGNGTTVNSMVPVQVSGLSNIVDIACGGGHSIAIKADGTVLSWGINNQGQLGNGTGGGSLVPTAISGATSPVALAAGTYHTLVLQSDGSVKATGDNASGQLGNGSITDKIILTPVTGLDLISP